MGKTNLKAEFMAADPGRQVRFSANIIEEMAEKGKPDRKIREYLEKIGASSDVVAEAFGIAFDEGILPERERAEAEAEQILLAEGGLSVKSARKVLSKLAYAGFDEEVLSEIAEMLQSEMGND